MTRSEKTLQWLASALALGELLERVRARFGEYELLEHYQQGEFHHDIVLRVTSEGLFDLRGRILVVATNCNGGVKEVLEFMDVPTPSALWRLRCPDNPEFAGEPARVLSRARTDHWFDPCDLLTQDARSEYRAEFRERQPGGGWVPKK